MITYSQLIELLFPPGFKDCCGIVAREDHMLNWRNMSPDIVKLIKEQDPSGLLLHVQDDLIVWQATHWQQSTTKRNILVKTVVSRLAPSREKQREHERFSRILNRIEKHLGKAGRSIVGGIIRNMYETNQTEETIKQYIYTYEQITKETIYEPPTQPEAIALPAGEAPQIGGETAIPEGPTPGEASPGSSEPAKEAGQDAGSPQS